MFLAAVPRAPQRSNTLLLSDLLALLQHKPKCCLARTCPIMEHATHNTHHTTRRRANSSAASLNACPIMEHGTQQNPSENTPEPQLERCHAQQMSSHGACHTQRPSYNGAWHATKTVRKHAAPQMSKHGARHAQHPSCSTNSRAAWRRAFLGRPRRSASHGPKSALRPCQYHIR